MSYGIIGSGSSVAAERRDIQMKGKGVMMKRVEGVSQWGSMSAMKTRCAEERDGLPSEGRKLARYVRILGARVLHSIGIVGNL